MTAGKKIYEMGQKIGDRPGLKKDFLNDVKSYLDSRGYRADLVLVANRKSAGNFPVEIRFNPKFSYPEDKDLMAIVSNSYPDHQINWNLAEVDPEVGSIRLVLEPSKEIIPVKGLKDIPPEFTSIGTALFSRKADASGNILEIWELKKDDGGYALYRRQDDTEILANDDAEFVAGDIVNTPDGPGKLVKYDEMGNAIVEVAGRRRMVAADSMFSYDIKKEKQKLYQYYAEVYGEEFAKQLTDDYVENK